MNIKESGCLRLNQNALYMSAEPDGSYKYIYIWLIGRFVCECVCSSDPKKIQFDRRQEIQEIMSRTTIIVMPTFKKLQQS